MKYVFLLFSLVFFIHFSFAEWDEAEFAFSPTVLGAGNTFSSDVSASYLTPLFADEKKAFFAGSSFLSGDVKVYYTVLKYEKYLFDIYFYNWGEMDYRDNWGGRLGKYYASSFSFSTSYIYKVNKNFKTALQLRFIHNEIGNVYDEKIFLTPSLLYEKNNWLLSLIYSSFSEGNFFIAGGYDFSFFRAKIKISYTHDDGIFIFYGGTFFLNDKKNYMFNAGFDINSLYCGFEIDNKAISFSYGMKITSEMVVINNFGINFKW